MNLELEGFMKALRKGWYTCVSVCLIPHGEIGMNTYWAKTPPFFEGLWKNCRPRAVLEARGRQFLTRVPRKKVEFYHYTLVLQGFPIILAEQCL